MPPFLKPFEGPIYGAFRIIVGLLFMQHGLQKVFGLFGGPPVPMNPALWAAAVIELVGGTLVALGLLTRWSAFLCSGTMAVAYFVAHATRAFHPLENHGELAILYCWAFFLIAATGSGAWSLDRVLGRD